MDDEPRDEGQQTPEETKIAEKGIVELSNEALATVAGGTKSLFKACCTGKHIQTGKITL